MRYANTLCIIVYSECLETICVVDYTCHTRIIPLINILILHVYLSKYKKFVSTVIHHSVTLMTVVEVLLFHVSFTIDLDEETIF